MADCKEDDALLLRAPGADAADWVPGPVPEGSVPVIYASVTNSAVSHDSRGVSLAEKGPPPKGSRDSDSRKRVPEPTPITPSPPRIDTSPGSGPAERRPTLPRGSRDPDGEDEAFTRPSRVPPQSTKSASSWQPTTGLVEAPIVGPPGSSRGGPRRPVATAAATREPSGGRGGAPHDRESTPGRREGAKTSAPPEKPSRASTSDTPDRGLQTPPVANDSGYASSSSSFATPLPAPFRSQIGCGAVDLLSLLWEREEDLMALVLNYLPPEDIARISRVCREWRRIVESYRVSAPRKRQSSPKQLSDRKKENWPYPKQTPTRATVNASSPLKEVQGVGPPRATSTPATRFTNHDRFFKAARCLMAEETQTKCGKGNCRSPARLLMSGQRAQCTRCGYDFCTDCLGPFHAATPCPALRRRAVPNRKSSGGAGSGQSRARLRRLALLDGCR